MVNMALPIMLMVKHSPIPSGISMAMVLVRPAQLVMQFLMVLILTLKVVDRLCCKLGFFIIT
jgi:hypothetical protein